MVVSNHKRCTSLTKKGIRCKNHFIHGEMVCSIHLIQDKICSICLDDIKQPIKLKLCSHIFCFHCINNWLCTNPTCPCCRQTTSINETNNAIRYGVHWGKIVQFKIIYYEFTNLTTFEQDKLYSFYSIYIQDIIIPDNNAFDNIQMALFKKILSESPEEICKDIFNKIKTRINFIHAINDGTYTAGEIYNVGLFPDIMG